MIDIQIAKPCHQSWTAMKGDDKARFCGACRKNVYNISEMTEAEVEDLIRRTEGHFCARLYRRTDQRVMTADCPKGVRAIRRKRTLAVTAAFGALAMVLAPALTPVYGQARVRRIPTRPITPLPVVQPEPEMGDVMATEEPDVRMGQVMPVRASVELTMGKAKLPVGRKVAGP